MVVFSSTVSSITAATNNLKDINASGPEGDRLRNPVPLSTSDLGCRLAVSLYGGKKGTVRFQSLEVLQS